jgi:hypothetical protein
MIEGEQSDRPKTEHADGRSTSCYGEVEELLRCNDNLRVNLLTIDVYHFTRAC